ncbi:hypothetical protein FHL15_001499 [Xylaria flabelliformis]|uniref:Uncharacterized protein n=1 Tax=Xylaria flabelliformis TaxID=2512241 RepID=A0A553IC34_9PEZI|nr:hypothetical protein FHL15_001499 [Xylaria flabelliformis]
MPTKHSIKVQVPIPSPISPAHVVATLQRFEPLLDNHYYVINYTPKAGPISRDDLAVIKGDPFFRQQCRDLNSSESVGAIGTEGSQWWIGDVWEDVYWVPFIVPYFSRLKRYLAIGCKTEGGIRFRQNVSGGVVTRGTFTVIERETGRPYRTVHREGVPADDVRPNDGWDGDTEKGSIISNTENERVYENEDENRDGLTRDGATGEKGTSNWDAQDETDAETEPAWDIVCECEIEMPLILIVSQFLRRDANRELCEVLCRCLIYDTIVEHDEYRNLNSDIVST